MTCKHPQHCAPRRATCWSSSIRPPAGGAAGGCDATLARLARPAAEVDLQADRRARRRRSASRAASGGPAAGAGRPRWSIAGGDGTINEAVNGLCPAGRCRRLSLALRAARHRQRAGQRDRPRHAPAAIARAIADGAAGAAYRARPANGRCFTIMAGVGFDAHVVANAHLRLKRLFGKGAYVVESLRQLGRFPLPALPRDGRRRRPTTPPRSIVAKRPLLWRPLRLRARGPASRPAGVPCLPVRRAAAAGPCSATRWP